MKEVESFEMLGTSDPVMQLHKPEGLILQPNIIYIVFSESHYSSLPNLLSSTWVIS
jgi:hypothetical protein